MKCCFIKRGYQVGGMREMDVGSRIKQPKTKKDESKVEAKHLQGREDE